MKNLSSAEQRLILEPALRYSSEVKKYVSLNIRKYCPEIQLDTLLADGGGGLLNLVAAVLKVKDDDTIAFVENKRFDQIVGTAE